MTRTPKTLQEAYLSVYQPQEITEEVEIAAQYFYEQGLNEYGVEILIEELGLDEFVDWVYDIAEEYSLSEGAKRGGLVGTKSQIAKARKEQAARTKQFSSPTTQGREARKAYKQASSASRSAARQQAASTAKSEQPASSSTPSQTRQGIGGVIGRAIERGRQDIETTKRLSGQTAQAAGKFAKGVGQAWQDVADSKLGKLTRVGIKQGLRRQQKAIDTVAPMIGRAAGRAAANVPAIVSTYRAGQRVGSALRVEEYELLLTHLLDEGYADTIGGAEKIASCMSEEWIYDILDEAEKLKRPAKMGEPIPQRMITTRPIDGSEKLTGSPAPELKPSAGSSWAPLSDQERAARAARRARRAERGGMGSIRIG